MADVSKEQSITKVPMIYVCGGKYHKKYLIILQILTLFYFESLFFLKQLIFILNQLLKFITNLKTPYHRNIKLILAIYYNSICF